MTEKSIILIVDDNQTQRKVISLVAERYGYLTHAVSSAKEALDALNCTDAYAAILMDCQMPGMDGLDCTRRIRELDARRKVHTPIIAVTADVTSENQKDCLQAGMDDFLAKPFSAEQFAQLLTKWAVKNQLAEHGSPLAPD